MKGPVKENYFFIREFPDFDEKAKATLEKGREHNFIHGSSLYKKKAFDDIEGYREEKDIPEDYNLFGEC